MVFKKFVVKKCFSIYLYYILKDSVAVDPTARCKKDQLKMLLKLPEHLLQAWPQTYENL